MVNILLKDDNIKNFIESLKISEEQKSFLFNELPKLNEAERLELLETLKNIYLLNEEEKLAIEKVKQSF